MGGSGGGGSSSGKIKYPAYMEAFHGSMLDNGGADTFTNSVVDAINAAYGSSPFDSVVAFDPVTELTAMDSALCAFDAAVNALDNDDDWESAMTAARVEIDTNVVSTAYIDADVAEFSDLLDDERDTKILPRFKAGMANINAAMSSSFVMGEAIIEAFGARDVSKYSKELRMKLNWQRNEMIVKAAETMLSNLMSRIGYERDVAHYRIEMNRLSIAAYKEQDDRDMWLDEQDALWDVSLFAYGGNALAAIAGAAASTREKGPSQAQSAVSGAVSGAAMGYMMSGGNPYGAAAGAAIGLGASLL